MPSAQGARWEVAMLYGPTQGQGQNSDSSGADMPRAQEIAKADATVREAGPSDRVAGNRVDVADRLEPLQ